MDSKNMETKNNKNNILFLFDWWSGKLFMIGKSYK